MTDDTTTRAETRAMTVVDAQPPSLGWTREDLDALKATLGADLSNAEFKVFVAASRRLGLDPFARQVVPIKLGKRMTVQTTIDGFRLIAERTRKYAGQLGPYWCGPDGEWREVWLSDSPPAAARVGVLRRDFDQPMWGVARFKSYAKDGTWQTMPDVMIAKVAESIALRKAFPNELSGVYTDDELDGSSGGNGGGSGGTDMTDMTDMTGTATTRVTTTGRWGRAEKTALFRRAKALGIANPATMEADMSEVFGHDAPFTDDEWDAYAVHIAREEQRAREVAAASPTILREMEIPTGGIH